MRRIRSDLAPALGCCAEGKPGVETPFHVIQILALKVYGAIVDLD
jgi:hypothetical protein